MVQPLAQLSRPAPTLRVWRIRPVLLRRMRANKMLGCLSGFGASKAAQHVCCCYCRHPLLTSSGNPDPVELEYAYHQPPIATHQACYHLFLALSAPEQSEPVALAVWEGQPGQASTWGTFSGRQRGLSNWASEGLHRRAVQVEKSKRSMARSKVAKWHRIEKSSVPVCKYIPFLSHISESLLRAKINHGYL